MLPGGCQKADHGKRLYRAQRAMITRCCLFHLWKRQVFVRDRHEDVDALLSIRAWTGVYLIGCANEIVYVGQT
jgi:hypothetical protein